MERLTDKIDFNNSKENVDRPIEYTKNISSQKPLEITQNIPESKTNGDNLPTVEESAYTLFNITPPKKRLSDNLINTQLELPVTDPLLDPTELFIKWGVSLIIIAIAIGIVTWIWNI